MFYTIRQNNKCCYEMCFFDALKMLGVFLHQMNSEPLKVIPERREVENSNFSSILCINIP